MVAAESDPETRWYIALTGVKPDLTTPQHEIARIAYLMNVVREGDCRCRELAASVTPSLNGKCSKALRRLADTVESLEKLCREAVDEFLVAALKHEDPRGPLLELADAVELEKEAWTHKHKCAKGVDSIGAALALTLVPIEHSRPTVKDYSQELERQGLHISEKALYYRIHQMHLPLAPRGHPKK